MSLHIELNDDAIRALKRDKQKAYLFSLFATVIGIGSLVAILYFCKILIFQEEAPQISCTVYPNETSNMEEDPKPEIQQETSSSAPTPAVNVTISANVASDISIPHVDMDITTPTEMLGSSLEIGLGTEGKGEDTTASKLMGNDKPSNNALVGTFYDTKQTRGGAPTNLSTQDFIKLLSKFVGGNWNESELSKFYRSSTKLYASQFYIPMTDAAEAPKAYKCDDSVKPSRWIAIYKGKVKAPKTGKFRFVGAGDDALAVRFNNQTVFDYGYYHAAIGKKLSLSPNWTAALTNKSGYDAEKKELLKANINVPPVTFYKYSTTPVWNREINGVIAGKTFSVVEGQTYPIEILISEIPGGKFGMVLLIEEVGATYPDKDKTTGAPILPLFRTNHGVPITTAKEKVPFDEIGIVWEVVQ